MTNNFSTIKNKQRSEKIILCRLNPGRQIIDDLVLSASTTYTATFNFPISGIKVDGVAYTLNNATALSSTQYSHNESTGLLTIYLSAVKASFVAVIVYYYLFYTNDKNRQAHQDPEDTTTTLRNWEGRILGSPDFEITQDDIIDSVLTIGNTNISLINLDNDFNQYLTDNDSFSKKEVKIWQCLNKKENIQKFFFGIISNLTIGNNVDISIDNILTKLDDNLFSTTTHLASIFNITSYPNVINESLDNPIHRIYSQCSRAKDTRFLDRGYSTVYGALNNQYQFSMDDSYALTNISYSYSTSKTLNRVWAACFASTASSILTETVANVATINGATDYVYEIDVADSTYYRPGDEIAIDDGGGYDNGPYVFAVISATRIQIQSVAAIVNGYSIRRQAIPMIQFLDASDGTGILRYGRDYTISTDANGVYNITLADNFENNWAGTSFNANGIPANQQFIYRVYNHDALDHGTVVQTLLENVGLTVNAASISTANSTSIKTNFSIPLWGETSFSKVRDVLEKMLASTFSFIYLNNSFEIGYALIDTISATNEITDAELIINTLSINIDYKDICTSFIYQNDHGEKTYGYDGGIVSPTGIIVKNTQYQSSTEKTTEYYLHEVKKRKTINFITQDMANSKTRIENALSKRRGKYNFTTKGINFSTILGDNFILVSDKVIGTTGQKNIKIFSINKSANETKLKGLDLLGL